VESKNNNCTLVVGKLANASHAIIEIDAILLMCQSQLFKRENEIWKSIVCDATVVGVADQRLFAKPNVSVFENRCVDGLLLLNSWQYEITHKQNSSSNNNNNNSYDALLGAGCTNVGTTPTVEN
jgi:hypothetical protein